MSGRLAGRAGPVAVVVALAAGVGLVRLRTIDAPLACDAAIYAVIGREMVEGRRLYADLWDHKPPAVHGAFAAADAIAGPGRPAVFLVAMAAVAATLAGVFAAGGARGIAGGAWAALFLAATASDVRLEADQPNAEALQNACVAGAFALLVRAGGRLSAARLGTIGLLVALASAVKQIAVAQAAAVAVAHAALPPEGTSRRRAAFDVAVLAAIGAAAWAGMGLYFALDGRFQDFYDAVFVFNRWYAADAAASLAASLSPANLAPRSLLGVAPALALAALGGALAWRSGRRREAALLAALAAGTHVAVALPGKFFAHYYQLWFVPAAVGAGWGAALLDEALARRGLALRRAIPVAALGLALSVEANDLFLSPRKPSVRSELAREDARAIEHLLAPGETFYAAGVEPALYVETGRRPPAGAFYSVPVWQGPLVEEMNRRVIADLERERPELLVFPLYFFEEPRLRYPAVDWCLARYEPLPDGYHGRWCAFFARRGGELERRVRSGEVPPLARAGGGAGGDGVGGAR